MGANVRGGDAVGYEGDWVGTLVLPQSDTMIEKYPICQVNPNWMIDQESMGSKEKFWYRYPEDPSDTAWLFKYPRSNSGEHWAEKIAAEVAAALEIPHARVELAVCLGIRGTITESFVASNETLVHGNELLELAISDYNPGQIRRPPLHNVDNILKVLEDVCTGMDPGFSDKLKMQVADYLILDALIGNTDRHHENWGVLLDANEDSLLGLAPSFDHASSLGRELTDERRMRHIAEETIGNYAAAGRGGIYWLGDISRRPAPLDLACRAMAAYAGIFTPGLEKLAMLEESNILQAVNMVPEEWMANPERDFAVVMMRYSLQRLRGLI